VLVFSILPLVFILVMIVIVIFIVVAAVMRKEGGEEMVKTVYVYVVLFATLMMVIGGGVGIFMSVADIVFPEPYYQSFQDYRFTRIQNKALPVEPSIREEISGENLSEEALKNEYEDMVARERDRQVNRAKNTLIKSFGWIVIPLPVFLFFKNKDLKKKPSEK
jgi:hypothetical protein